MPLLNDSFIAPKFVLQYWFYLEGERESYLLVKTAQIGIKRQRRRKVDIQNRALFIKRSNTEGKGILPYQVTSNL